jgi:hypothetical protein
MFLAIMNAVRQGTKTPGGVDIMKTRARQAILVTLIALLLLMPAACRAKVRQAVDRPPAERVSRQTTLEVVEFPFRLVSDHIVLSASINGSDQMDMLLDTGMPMRGAILLDPSLIDGIDLEYVGTVDLGGGGSDAPATADVAARATISISGVEFSGQSLMVLRDAEFAEDWPVGAIIGKTVFDRVVEIDFDGSVIKLYDSVDDMPSEPGERFRMDFTMGIPVIDARVMTAAGRTLPVSLIADTGVNDPFVLFAHSSKGLELPDQTLRCKNGILAEGLSGDMLGSLGRTPRLELGSFTLTDLITGFPDESTMGHAGMLGQNGFIGIGIMKRFTVVFDYGQEAFYLKPGRDYREPFEWNMAGLLVWVNREGFLQVKDIVEESPGWKNGIRPGDVITTIDGNSIDRMDNEEIFGAFSRDGAEVSLSVLRDEDLKTVSLKLRRLI